MTCGMVRILRFVFIKIVLLRYRHFVSLAVAMDDSNDIF